MSDSIARQISDPLLTTPDVISERLQRSAMLTEDVPVDISDAEFMSAAVLVPFVHQDDEWHLLYIRRAHHEDDYHGGQVAFAGGKQEPVDDNLHQTALREAHEEIGLAPGQVRVLGQLNYHYSVSRFRIMPVVAHIHWPCELVLDTSEVARVFTIPLRWLANPDNYEVRPRTLIDGRSYPVVYFDEYDGELLWGATAKMTLSLLWLLCENLRPKWL